MVHMSTLALEDLLKCASAQDMLMGTKQITGPINLHDEVGCVYSTAFKAAVLYAPDDTKSSVNWNLTKRLIKKNISSTGSRL